MIFPELKLLKILLKYKYKYFYISKSIIKYGLPLILKFKYYINRLINLI